MKSFVIKIGGSLLKSYDSYIKISEYIRNFIENKNEKVYVVISAVKGATDLLIDFYDNNRKESLENFINLYREISLMFDNKVVFNEVDHLINELVKISSNHKPENQFLRDKVLSYGEKISKVLLKHALSYQGVDVNAINAEDFILTDNKHGDAFVDLEKTKEKLKQINLNNKVIIIEGFIGKSYNGETTTLGRGGSDYTASVIAYSFNSDNLYLVTDVPGIFTSDPKLVINARIVKKLSFEEAIEASKYNVKGINYKTFYPLLNSKTIVYIGQPNNFNTTISYIPQYHISAKLIGHKISTDSSIVGLVGFGMNKDMIIKNLYEIMENNGIENFKVDANEPYPSISLSFEYKNVEKVISSIHDSVVGWL